MAIHTQRMKLGDSCCIPLCNMAVTYTHAVSLLVLLAFLLLLDVTASSTRGHLVLKDFPESEKFNKREAVNNGSKTRGHRNDKFQVESDPRDENIYTEVLGQTRTTVVLHCDTRRLEPMEAENKTVIWVKLHDNSFTILSEGKRILYYDKRFAVSNKTDPQDWSLYIRYTKLEDQGLYKCQICDSSNYTNSIFVKLKLREARAEIIGTAVREVDKVGSPLRLSCELKDSIEAPKYIYWYHGDRMINYDLYDGATVREGRQGSELIFPRAQEDHAGNYSCVPSNAVPASVLVKINAKTSGAKNNKGSGGEKSHPQRLIINMLTLVSIFPVYR